MSDSTMTKIDLFFEDPAVYHAPPRSYSVLYLLRRDISVCLGIDPDSDNPIAFQALWPGTMAILAGIDLLGKFLVGNDNFRKSRKRFKNFIESKYFQVVSQTDAEIIYQLRNSLLHSFGLYSEDGKGNVYRFTLIPKQGPLVQRLGDNYLVDVRTLHSQFETAIENYRADLKKDLSLQECFNAMFPKYGVVYIHTILNFSSTLDLTVGSDIVEGFPYEYASGCD